MSKRGSATVPAAVMYSPILDAIGIAITSGQYEVGHVLTLEQLQQQFGVSRTIAREVMRILESMQLVQSRRRVGLVVQGPESWNVFDARVIRWRLDGSQRDAQLRTLTELRVAIEPYAASAAAESATDAERVRIVELAKQMRELGEAGSLEEFLERDIEFHTLLLRATRNEMFSALTDLVAEVLTGRTHHGLMPDPVAPVALDAHENTALAVMERDPAAAEAAMHVAIAEVREALREESRNARADREQDEDE